MPPRRAPSQSSATPSRAPSPPMDDDDVPYFDTVEELQQHGINVQDILKLKIKGMSEAKVEKIKEAAHKILGSSFATGVEVQDKRKRVITISTGSKSVDGILGGAYTWLFRQALHAIPAFFIGGLMSQSISEGS
ncbi:hypothetical protein BDQ12DRAFT_230976 [Crucibulum laeve]|uniref:Uncharacterized protein n=1 Tax=Crucibulum laeve TaxID=68775 RepID=A0A5C3LX16_9AGAR|nr:hypothetical protein BDQ12DRAFT_230976 [Crucibulum laeve]